MRGTPRKNRIAPGAKKRPPRRNAATSAAMVVATALLGGVLLPVQSVSALDTNVKVCTDDSLCTDLTVRHRPAPEPEPRLPGTVLQPCGSAIFRDGYYWQDHCDGLGNRYNIRLEIAERPRVPTRQDISRSARGYLNPPTPRINTSPKASRLLVHTPTWLWLSPGYWRTYTRTLSLMGVTVVMSATPTHVKWSMGNGDSITCLGPGNPWLGGSGEIGSTCSYTYRHSSARMPGDRYRVTAEVFFVGSFVTTGAVNLAGPLGIVTRKASRFVKVGEVQGLIVS